MKLSIDKVDDFLKLQIEAATKRLKGSVSEIDILKWLNNFKVNEYGLAIDILNKLEYFTEKELIELLNERLKKLFTIISIDTKVIIHPIGSYGKSGTLLIYYLKKTPLYIKNQGRIEIFTTYQVIKNRKKANEIKHNSILVLIDDFIGSGFSLINYSKTYVFPQLQNTLLLNNIYILTLFYLRRAENLIKKIYPSLIIIGDLRFPCFAPNRSVFGYRKKMLPFRNFSYKYGKDLFSLYNKEVGQTEIHPLGYENSQALLVFPYNPPNNTLPIIWSSKNNWYPLFPRSSESKISISKNYRKSLAYNLGLLKYSEVAKFFFSGQRDIGWKSFSFVTKTDFAIFAIANMIRQKKTIPIICQTLGITSEDYAVYISDGNKKGIFDTNGKLTSYGEEIYIEALKKLSGFKNEIKNEKLSYKINHVKFLPKTFKGRS